MGFFDNLVNGFKLGNATRKLVFKDSRLLIYPVLMGIVALVEFLVLFVGSLILSGGISAITGTSGTIGAGVYIGVILFYLASAFTSTYLTIAMLLAFRSFTKGKPIGMGEALSQTRPYLMLAFEWAVFYSTVVLLLNLIESRFRGIASIIISAVGSLALTVAIMFAIPAIVDNQVGPIKAVEISAKTLVSHFGNTFGGIAFTELFSLLITLAGVFIAIVGLFATGVSLGLGIVLIGIGIIVLAFGVILGFTLSNIFRFILYEYINGKGLPKGIDEQLIKGSIKKKNQGNSSTAVL